MEDRIERLPNSLELAFLGDTVYDFYIRRHLLVKGGSMKNLQKQASARVCAKAQSEALGRVESLLTDEEQDVVRRARNAKQHPPRNADPAQYHRATGLEALLGYLCIHDRQDRIETIMREIIPFLDETEGGNNNG